MEGDCREFWLERLLFDVFPNIGDLCEKVRVLVTITVQPSGRAHVLPNSLISACSRLSPNGRSGSFRLQRTGKIPGAV